MGAIAMCSLGMYGMGLLLNGATIKYKRVGSLLFLFQLGLLFVTDTIPSDSIVLSGHAAGSAYGLQRFD